MCHNSKILAKNEPKGQIISEKHFGVFNSSKNERKGNHRNLSIMNTTTSGKHFFVQLFYLLQLMNDFICFNCLCPIFVSSHKMKLFPWFYVDF